MAALTEKVAIITGGSNGIGKATALRLTRDGAKVVIQYRSRRCCVLDSEELIRRTVEKFGQIDIVIANAGSLPLHDLANTSEQDFNDSIDLNVKGPYFLVQVRHADCRQPTCRRYKKKFFAADG
ncbi:Short-chain dehydrogenase/reductase SDR [Penicillium roqueforti FM164]|uniref:Short-chain dehydrogenase/reductase SDR n=1 Tax=Penicillium roqueforti (strain FM164) TaxID=1365484 RepID=W6Q2T9_PENRF|nr:Short-chain dehydrogenase/reductase SDR [Penicillium roqueforti FM164]